MRVHFEGLCVRVPLCSFGPKKKKRDGSVTPRVHHQSNASGAVCRNISAVTQEGKAERCIIYVRDGSPTSSQSEAVLKVSAL